MNDLITIVCLTVFFTAIVAKIVGSALPIIAKKIGFPQEILNDAAEIGGKEHLNFDQQLQQLEIEKKEVRKKEFELKVADNLLNEVVTKYKNLLGDLEKRKNQLLKEANKEAQSLIDKANAKIERTIREIKEAQAEKERTRKARQELAEFRENLAEKEKEERALKDFNRNRLGLYLSAIVFFIVLLVTLMGMVLNKNLMMILLVLSSPEQLTSCVIRLPLPSGFLILIPNHSPLEFTINLNVLELIA